MMNTHMIHIQWFQHFKSSKFCQKNMVLNFKVVLIWGDVYFEIMRVVLLITGLKMKGFKLHGQLY